MPIIPSDWTGQETINALGMGSGSSPYKYCKSFTFTSNNLIDYVELIGKCEEQVNRELTIEIKSGKVDFYWKNYNNELFIVNSQPLPNNYVFIDNDLDCLGLTIKVLESCELFITLRWDADINFNIYGDEPEPEPQLLTVINNVIYINETLGNAATEPMPCIAYFADNVSIPNPTDWTQLFLNGLTDSEVYSVRRITYIPNFTENFVYPSVSDPYIFNINPWWLGYANFNLYQQWGENEPITQQLKIESFDSLTNTFILGVI